MVPARDWYGVSAPVLACRLLGRRLISSVGGERTSGIIVETEAYLGPDDPASHAAIRKGKSRKNASMFEAGGTSYLYFTYGMHWCFNVVSGRPGEPQAVLIRALEPLEGHEVMAARRGRRTDLATGPAKLCQALGLDGALDGHDLSEPPLWIESPAREPRCPIGVSGRIGIRKAVDHPLRFFIPGHPDLSRRRGPGARIERLDPELRDVLGSRLKEAE